MTPLPPSSVTDPNTPYPLSQQPADRSRLTSANVAQQIYWNLHQANLGRNNYGAYLQGICDGNPPYRQSSLRASGQGWRCNVNWRESKARKDAAKTPYYSLFADGPTYVEASLSEKDPASPLSSVDAAGIITEELHPMLEEWSGFDMGVWQMLDSFVGFGRGWLYWPMSDIWHFDPVPWWKVRFPDGTNVDPAKWTLFSIEHNFDPVTLNGYVKDEATARAAGWNPARVRQAIEAATPYDPQSSQDQMAVQQMIKDQDIQLMYRTGTVQAASIFVREFDGTWSRMIVEVGIQANDIDLGEGDWLYYKRGVASSIHELVAPFIFEVETGSINGLSGILQLITDSVRVKTRVLCEQVNNTFLRSTVLLQAQNASSRVKSGLITVGGGVTLIPEGMVVQPSTIVGDIQSTMVLNEQLGRELDVNSGVFRPQMEKPSGNPEPLGATQLRVAQASVLTNSAVNRFLQQLDWFYTELYRRACLSQSGSHPAAKAAKAFQKRCKDRGVTDKQLKAATVRATRTIGNGSPAMRSQLTTELAQLIPVLNLGQRGRENLAKAIIAARGGQAMVDRLKPIEDAQNVPTSQDREATEENGMVKIGNQVFVCEGDDPIVHLQHHFEAGFAALQSVQQGAPAHDAASFVQGILPHIQQHMAGLQRKEDVKAATKMFKQLSQGLKQLMAHIQQSQPDPAQQQQVMGDLQLKQLKTQSDIQLKQVKTQAQLQTHRVKTQQAMAIERAKAQQKLALEDAETAARIRREGVSALHEMALRNGEAEQQEGVE